MNAGKSWIFVKMARAETSRGLTSATVTRGISGVRMERSVKVKSLIVIWKNCLELTNDGPASYSEDLFVCFLSACLLVLFLTRWETCWNERVLHSLLDTRKGLCFAVVRNNMCEAVTKEMMQVRKKECCCTAGKAWGTNCQLCPRKGTGKLFLWASS